MCQFLMHMLKRDFMYAKKALKDVATCCVNQPPTTAAMVAGQSRSLERLVDKLAKQPALAFNDELHKDIANCVGRILAGMQATEPTDTPTPHAPHAARTATDAATQTATCGTAGSTSASIATQTIADDDDEPLPADLPSPSSAVVLEHRSTQTLEPEAAGATPPTAATALAFRPAAHTAAGRSLHRDGLAAAGLASPAHGGTSPDFDTPPVPAPTHFDKNYAQKLSVMAEKRISAVFDASILPPVLQLYNGDAAHTLSETSTDTDADTAAGTPSEAAEQTALQEFLDAEREAAQSSAGEPGAPSTVGTADDAPRKNDPAAERAGTPPPSPSPAEQPLPTQLERTESRLAVLSGCSGDLVAHLIECVSSRAMDTSGLGHQQVRELVEQHVRRSRVDALQASGPAKRAQPTFIDTFFLTYRMFLKPFALFGMLNRSMGSATTRFPVLAVLVHWTTHYWIDFEDNEELYDALLALTQSLKGKGNADQPSTTDTPSLQSITRASAKCEKMRTVLALTIQAQNKSFVFERCKNPIKTYGPTDLVVLQLRSRCIAEQLAVFNQRLLNAVDPVEYVFYYFPNSRPGGIERSPNLANAIKRFDQESYWVAAEIRLPEKVKDQASLITKFIKVADHSAKLGNFFSLFSILGALCFPEVTRLKSAWAKVPDKVKRLQSQLEDIMNPSRNMKNYRERLSRFTGGACVPCLPLHLKDLVFANEGGVQKNNIVNFEKLTMVARLVATLVPLRPYSGLRKDAALQAYLQVSIINPENPVITGLSQPAGGPSPGISLNRNTLRGKKRLKEVKQILLKSFNADGSHVANPDDSSTNSPKKHRTFFGKRDKKDSAPTPPQQASSAEEEAKNFDAERRRKFLIARVVSPTRSPPPAHTLGRGIKSPKVRSMSLTSRYQRSSSPAPKPAESDESDAEEGAVAEAWGDQSIIAMSMSPRHTSGNTPLRHRASVPSTPRTPAGMPRCNPSAATGDTPRVDGLNASFLNAVQRNPPTRATANMASSPLVPTTPLARKGRANPPSKLALGPRPVVAKGAVVATQVDVDAAMFSNALKRSALRALPSDNSSCAASEFDASYMEVFDDELEDKSFAAVRADTTV